MTRHEISLEAIDHVVLTVQNIERTARFYESVLGTRVVEANGRTALHFGQQKINLHEVGREFEPKARQPTPGSADVCFVTNTPAAHVADVLRERGVPIVEGPVERSGARGRLVSVYIRDPDGNLIEVSNYA